MRLHGPHVLPRLSLERALRHPRAHPPKLAVRGARGQPGEQPIPDAHAPEARHKRGDRESQAVRGGPGDGRRPKGKAENHLDEGVPQGVQNRLRAKDASAALVEVN